MLGVLDQLGICDPSTDSGSNDKWNIWLTQLEHAVEAAAALAFGAGTADQTAVAPTATFPVPVVFAPSASFPTATLLLAVVLASRAP